MSSPSEPEQGALLTGCFRCELLAIAEPLCARCAGAPRFVVAQMMSRDEVARHVERLVVEWERAPAATTLIALLEALHLHGPPAHAVLVTRGTPTLAQLAAAYIDLPA